MWEDREVADLDRYVDLLQAEGRRGKVSIPVGLEDLAAVVRWLRYVLVPVEPSPLFRQALHARLLTAAKVGLEVPASPWHSQHRRGLLIGAAVGSALSVAGLAALIARLRWPARHAA